MVSTTRGRSTFGDRIPGVVDRKATSVAFFNDKSVQFTETGDDYIQSDANFEDFSGPSLTNKITVSFWHKETSASRGSFDAIYGVTTSASWNDGFGGRWAGNTLSLWWQHFNQLNRVDYVTSGASFVNNWHHYVFTYNGSESSNRAKIYVDGVLESQVTGNDEPASGLANRLEIGRLKGTPGSLDIEGNVDEFAIWNIALNVGDIQALYGNGNAGSQNPVRIQPSNLIVFYRMGDLDDSIATGILDRSGNGNDASANVDAGFPQIVDDPALVS